MSIGKAMCFSAELNFYPDTFPHAHPPTRLYYFLFFTRKPAVPRGRAGCGSPLTARMNQNSMKQTKQSLCHSENDFRFLYSSYQHVNEHRHLNPVLDWIAMQNYNGFFIP